MNTPVVTSRPVLSRILFVGQAPGVKEPILGRPFAWTAGKTLFKWFQAACGIDEETFRSRIYMAAVCRCYPGKNPTGGDRVPDDVEIENCKRWLNDEWDLLRPGLLIPVGSLAIRQFLEFDKLKDVIGQTFEITKNNITCDVIPLPHPSGASTWHRTEPGRTLLEKALKRINDHPVFRSATDEA
jgi:uracil-DNA glycosylase